MTQRVLNRKKTGFNELLFLKKIAAASAIITPIFSGYAIADSENIKSEKIDAATNSQSKPDVHPNGAVYSSRGKNSKQEPRAKAKISQSNGDKSKDEKILERITVIGDSSKIADIPGTGAMLSGKALEEAKTGVGDVTRALRSIPGVNVVEEEGFGVRPNIGMRGTPSERSSAITLMEDGVLIAPAPYAAPAAYYFPTFGRMSGVEVLKGAGQIKYGPRTTGGSLNLLSTLIPDKFTLQGDIATGSHDTTRGHIYLGDSTEWADYLLETYQLSTDGFKNLDGGGDTGYDLQDFLGKIRFKSDESADYYQQLQLKAGYYEQDGNETYLGLTKNDFEKTPNRRYAASQLDTINIKQHQLQAQHYIEISDNIDLTTTGYYNGTERRWNKLDSVQGQSLGSILDNPERYSDAYDWLSGAGDSPDNALTMTDAAREYFGTGIQSVLVAKKSGPVIDHRFELGARYHEDEEDRKQKNTYHKMENGRMVETSSGPELGNANRVSSASATALYAQDTLTWKKWRFIPGLRYEQIDLKRLDYGGSDPLRLGTSLKENTDSLDVFIPGFGADYSISDTVTAFVGVHKGFSPPGPSTKNGVREEESIAYELGANIQRGTLVSQVAAFLNDYDNLLGVDSLSSGGSGTGDQFNLGEARTYGLESSIRYDWSELTEGEYRLPVYATYTFTDATFSSSFKSDIYGEVSSGERIPYISEHQFAVGAGVEHDNYGKLLFRSYFVDSMPTQPIGSSLSSAPRTDSFYVVDMHVESPEIKKGMHLYLDITNLFNNEYIVALRPSGARPGMPLTALGGVKFKF